MIPLRIHVISELYSVEGQSKLSVHHHKEWFFIINNRNRRLFAWRHLEAGQYVAQSGLHLHQSEPHSCKENKQNCRQELRNACACTISPFWLSIAFNKIYYGNHYRNNKTCKRQEIFFSDRRNFMITTEKWKIEVENWYISKNLIPNSCKISKSTWIFLYTLQALENVNTEMWRMNFRASLGVRKS